MLEFDFRAKRIMQEIAESKAGIICFQEMNRIEEYYEKALKKLGYTLIRTGHKRGACKLETPIAISK